MAFPLNTVNSTEATPAFMWMLSQINLSHKYPSKLLISFPSLGVTCCKSQCDHISKYTRSPQCVCVSVCGDAALWTSYYLYLLDIPTTRPVNKRLCERDRAKGGASYSEYKPFFPAQCPHREGVNRVTLNVETHP